MGAIKGDTASLDYSSYVTLKPAPLPPPFCAKAIPLVDGPEQVASMTGNSHLVYVCLGSDV